MADFNQFGSVRPIQSADAKVCSQFEAMLADAVDGILTAEEQAAFDRHLVGCASCSEMLADAKRGAAWMEMLRQHTPEPPAAMLERILAQTSGARAAGSGVGLADLAGGMSAGVAPGMSAALGAPGMDNVLPFRARAVRGFDFRGLGHTLLQPRLAMTAAMAFFSIALTLNLTGVRISELRVSDLKPSSLRRSMYEANAHVVRYYTNLRVVYELESRVHDLQRASDEETPAASTAGNPQTDDGVEQKGAQPKGKDQKGPESQPKRRVSPGTSRREPLHQDQRVLALGTTGDTATSTIARLSPRVDLQRQERGTV